MSPRRLVVLGFMAAIAVGTLLLMLPVSRQGEGGAPLLVAFFTSTSAVCVTGHTVVDTPSYWSGFGEAVILGMFQIGGFGIMAAGALLILIAGRRIGLRGRLLAQSESRALAPADVRRVLAWLAVFTLTVEAATAAVLTLRLRVGYDRSWGEAVWGGVFHAASAFNGAGFALQSDSLAAYASDAAMIVPIGLAVMVGGIGFPVILDLRRSLRAPSRWALHTKLTLLGSTVLLWGGTLLLGVFEWGNPGTLGSLDTTGRVLGAWFQSVSTRSAGLTTIDVGAMRDESWFLSDALMFIGGGSGSTAGGIKVGTAVVLVLIVVSEVRGGRPAQAFGRTIPVASLRQALSVAFVAVNVVTIGTLALMAMTPFGLGQCLFEVVSSFGIVGLSTGITAEVGAAGQVLLAVLMFLGRVGPLTLVTALAARERVRLYSYPEERPQVG